MNKRRFGLIVIITIAAFLLAACGGENGYSLVGLWESNSRDVPDLEFFHDGTGWMDGDPMTWSVSDDRLTMDYGQGWILVSEFEILDDSMLILSFLGQYAGHGATFTRIRAGFSGNAADLHGRWEASSSWPVDGEVVSGWYEFSRGGSGFARDFRIFPVLLFSSSPEAHDELLESIHDFRVPMTWSVSGNELVMEMDVSGFEGGQGVSSEILRRNYTIVSLDSNLLTLGVYTGPNHFVEFGAERLN